MLIKHCTVCNSSLNSKETICSSCKRKLDEALISNSYFRCKNCGYPLIDELYSCTECTNRNGLYVYSIYDYRNYFAKELLFDYKFNYNKKISKLYADIIKEYISNFDYIIPIPSSNASLKKRGWDQMIEILKHLIVNVQAIIKNNDEIIHIKEQKTLGREERIKETINKFAIIDTDLDKSKKVLLIDDVITTGSTLVSCYNLLKNNGFSDIQALTLYIEY